MIIVCTSEFHPEVGRFGVREWPGVWKEAARSLTFQASTFNGNPPVGWFIPPSLSVSADRVPKYKLLSPLIHKYPRSGGALFQAYNDLSLSWMHSFLLYCATESHPAQQWTDLEVLDLTGCSRGAFRGRKPRTVGIQLFFWRSYNKWIIGHPSMRFPLFSFWIVVNGSVSSTLFNHGIPVNDSCQNKRSVSWIRWSARNVHGYHIRGLVDCILQV